jgi:NADPH2:quinone reductase
VVKPENRKGSPNCSVIRPNVNPLNGEDLMKRKMQSVAMKHPGTPEVLELRSVPLPWPGDEDHVLVRLKAAGLNQADAYFRSMGPYVGDGIGCILGHDGAGVVEAVGPSVTRVRVGDEVCFCYGGIGASAGTYAQFSIVPENLLVLKPSQISFIEAAALPLVFITLWEALHERAAVNPGEYVLVHAGAGGTGHIGVQVAKNLGGRVAATVSTSQKADFVSKLGADFPILYREVDFVKAARDWSRGHGMDVALDNLGATIMQQTFRAMAPYGRVVTLMGTPADTEDMVAYNHNLGILNVMMLTPMWHGMVERLTQQAEIVEKGIQWLANKKIQVHISEVFDLEQAAEAHRMLEVGGITGKIVLEINI